MARARGLEVHRRELFVQFSDARILADVAEREDRREQRVLRDLRRRAALSVLLRDFAPELRLLEHVVRARFGHAETARVVGDLARDRRGRGEFFSLLRGRERVLEILQREVLQVVLAQDANAVHEAFEHVFERAALATDLHEHLKAVERALAQAHRLEVIGRFFDETNRRDDRVVRLARVFALLRATREVELHERRVVRVRAAARHLREARPERARADPILRLLAIDRGGRDETRVLHFARGALHVAECCERARAIDGRHLLELRLRALRAVALGRHHVPEHGERAPRVAAFHQHVFERTQHAEVIVLRDVRLRGRRDERVRGVVEISTRERLPGALSQVVEIIQHGSRHRWNCLWPNKLSRCSCESGAGFRLSLRRSKPRRTAGRASIASSQRETCLKCEI